jgi:hypothetical protein
MPCPLIFAFSSGQCKALLFLKKNRYARHEAKKLFLCWAMGVISPTPMTQHKKKFLRRFFQKAATFFLGGRSWILIFS